MHNAAEHIAAQVVGAEQVRRRRWAQDRIRDSEGIVGGNKIDPQGNQHECQHERQAEEYGRPAEARPEDGLPLEASDQRRGRAAVHGPPLASFARLHKTCRRGLPSFRRERNAASPF